MIKIVSILFIVIVFIIVLISVYVGFNLTKPKREGIEKTPKDYGLLYEKILFNSFNDDTLLKGWWIPSQENKKINENKGTVIFAHGYGNSRCLKDISILNLAKTLVQEGYNVLTFDFRASGESNGKICSIGEKEKFDLLSAIEFAKKHKKSKDIYLIGWSMGAVVAILAGVESKYVKGIIADSPFANLKDYVKENLPKWSNLPKIPFTPIILGIIPILLKVKVDNVSPVKAVANLKDKHLLLIHSKDDTTIPYSDSKVIYEGVKDKRFVHIWLTKKAKHIRSYVMYKDEYERKILSFLKK